MNQNWLKDISLDDLEGPYHEIALKMGVEAALKIAELFQGSQVYFPRMESSCGEKRKELILQEFNGYNYRELAQKYGFSERWIREICSDQVQKERNKPCTNQISIFEVE
ncbi:Mor transcription activator family protein [Anaerosolibacter sp.]|uniref:Mor transcription activator family protein n=1 Tax=Anaerosolibacter sp. TaxID=1872527 RepID=UPI0039EF6E3E